MLRSDHSAFSSSLPFARWAWLGRGLVIATLGLGCTPKIGDECTVSTNCSSTGDRLCDVTQPGGYCTKFNCEPGNCPEDSVCVNFGTTLSNREGSVAACTPSQANSPYKRSFCMATCSSDGDCRGGYACREASVFHGVLAEKSGGQKVCAVLPADQVPTANPPKEFSTEVCEGSDAGPGAGGAPAGGGSNGGANGASGASGTSDGGAAGEGGAGG